MPLERLRSHVQSCAFTHSAESDDHDDFETEPPWISCSISTDTLPISVEISSPATLTINTVASSCAYTFATVRNMPSLFLLH